MDGEKKFEYLDIEHVKKVFAYMDERAKRYKEAEDENGCVKSSAEFGHMCICEQCLEDYLYEQPNVRARIEMWQKIIDDKESKNKRNR